MKKKKLLESFEMKCREVGYPDVKAIMSIHRTDKKSLKEGIEELDKMLKEIKKEKLKEQRRELEEARKKSCSHSLLYLICYKKAKKKADDRFKCKCIECESTKTFGYEDDGIFMEAPCFLRTKHWEYIIDPRWYTDFPSYKDLRKKFLKYKHKNEAKAIKRIISKLTDKYEDEMDKEDEWRYFNKKEIKRRELIRDIHYLD